MSSLASAPGTQGSGREESVRCRDVVPTGWRPVGLGRYGVLRDVRSGTSPGVTGESADAGPGVAGPGVAGPGVAGPGVA
ncbi:hypothetical protein AB0D67_08930, partial [Streptosporangium sp. NPDC048047]